MRKNGNNTQKSVYPRRHKRTGLWSCLLLCLTVFALLVPVRAAMADDNSKADEIKNITSQMKTIEEGLKRNTFNLDDLGNYSRELMTYKLVTGLCMQSEQNALTKADADLKQLGEIKIRESREVLKLRRQQEADRNAIEARLQMCTALNLRIQTAQENLDTLLKKKLEAKLFARGHDIFDVIAMNLKEPVKWFAQSWDYTNKNSWLLNAVKPYQLKWLIGSFILAALAGLILRRRCRPWVARRDWNNSSGGRFAKSTLVTFFHDAPYLFTLVALSVCMGIFTGNLRPTPVSTALIYSLTFFYVARLIIRVGLNPVPPCKLFMQVEPAVARRLAQRLHVLALVVMIGYLINDTLLWVSLPDFARSLARSVVRILLAVNIVWVLWLFQHLTGKLRHGIFRYSLSLVLVFAVLADLSGYANLSGWLFRSVFGTLVAFVIVLTLMRLNKELFVSLEYAHTPAQQRIRKLLGLPLDGHLAFFFWVRILVSLGLWLLLVWMLILIWDLSASAVQQLNAYLSNGFVVGELRIVPMRVLLALVTLTVLVALTSWVKGLMKTQLESSPMERGTREAMTTMTGYVGVLLAIVIALAMAGINFTNLALIAGALSVGIGFGLQNIVNNFISGLILLFERPIKRGDWIVVGNTEGYVKRIRIRSTQLQTFDRADVIVPNAELITGQVTNWMLSDTSGRARIPIGVAYGSDVEKVRDILLHIAGEHPDVISDGSAPEPFVLFREFADSSLNFELRCHIRNIDNRLRVISDINFAIDKAFREAKISIPFPQRDVHIYQTSPGKTDSDEV